MAHAAFAALGDHNRLAMVEHLAHGEATLSELAAPLGISLPAVHKHLGVLEQAGLVTSRKVGRSRHVRLRAHGLDDASRWLTQMRHYWNERLDALHDLLEEEP